MKIGLNTAKRSCAVGAISLAILFSSGCAAKRAYLVPAPSDMLTNAGRAATAHAEGVKIVVMPNDWNGRPRNLYRYVTPLNVRIENHSKRPVRLAYEDFHLQTPRGRELAALPPSQIRGAQYSENATALTRMTGTVTNAPYESSFVAASFQRGDGDHDVDDVDHGHRSVIIVNPGFDSDDFYYAPYWGYGYFGLGPWPYWWGPDMGYYNYYYPYMRRMHLPTRSMLKKGLPEGVIAPGGYVQGFLYFSRVNPKLTTVTFVANLQSAHNGRRFGKIQIPFQVTQTQ